MMEHGMHHHHSGSRRVLMIKGFAWGVQREKIEEAYAAAEKLIIANGITTIIWDGDPMQYLNEGGYFHGSFTALIDKLMRSHPTLEFIYFKKDKDIKDIVTGFGKVEPEKYGTPYKNVIGPFERLTTENTSFLDGDANEPPPPPSGPIKNYGVKFVKTWEGRMFYMLGLKGLMYIKNVLKADKVDYLIVGIVDGSTVDIELKEVAKNPDMYPEIVATPIKVVRG